MALSLRLAIIATSASAYFHHNIDRGKVGIILDANTASYYESVDIEVDAHSGAF